jgi:leucyl-tRNA synthetase
LKSDGKPVEYDGIGTMSKSKNNGVDPQDLIEKYGADTARLFMMFASPPEQTLEWSDAGVEGSFRFLKRLWAYAHDYSALVQMESKRSGGDISRVKHPHDLARTAPHLAALRRQIHSVLKQATFDMQRNQFNTVASAAMKMLNALQEGIPKIDGTDAPGSLQAVVHEGFGILLRVLYPITPHISHTLWQELGYAGEIAAADWPAVDEAALDTDEIELVLQVNGKLRGHMRAPRAAGREQLEQLALAHESVTRFTDGQPVKKVVVVPGRLVNVVV